MTTPHHDAEAVAAERIERLGLRTFDLNHPSAHLFIERIGMACEEVHAAMADNGFWSHPAPNIAGELVERLTGDDAHDAEIRAALNAMNANRAEKFALMVTELAEGIEGLRKNAMDSHLPQFSNAAVELADCVIRIFDYCGAYDIPLGEIIVQKMVYNLQRPHKHGKKF